MRYIKNNQKGGFLIELMVGLLLSSLTVLSVTTIYTQFELQKRTTVETGTTSSTANIGMFSLQNHAKKAGYGVSYDLNMMGCSVAAYNSTNNQDITFKLAPVSIEPGNSASTSDKVTFFAGNSYINMFPIQLTADTNSNNDTIKISDISGFSPGDLIILYEANKNCNLAQISETQGTNNILRNTGNYVEPATNRTLPVIYNKSGGLSGGVNYSINATVLDIGSSPMLVSNSIVNNQLVETNILTSESKVIADNIVLLKALYGIDMDHDGKIDTWNNNNIGSNYKYLKAIKIALIARTPNKEIKNGVCNATNNPIFNWDGKTIDISTLSDDWGCYRYRFIETVIPLRNVIWNIN
jgi:type IV pilus assembly protein PilW